MPPQLAYVDPDRWRGPLSRAYAALANTRLGRFLSVNIFWKVDPYVLRWTGEIRFVQLTPPGSACSIAIGKGVTEGAPGSLRGLQLVVEAAREELLGRGMEVGEVEKFPWGSFVFFSDPDGNGWSVQELPPRE